MWPVKGFDGVHLVGWERGETDKGVPYFIHHDSELTQWDHPLLLAAMEEIMDSNNIKYAAYRTAMKIRILQKFVKFNLVTLPTMISVFDQHGFRLDKNDAYMSCDELEGVLADIFHVTKCDQSSIADTELLSEMTLNVLLNFFDRDRSGMIKASSAKVALTILCSARLQEKYKYLFRQSADHNNCISKKKLIELLTDLAQIPEYLSEKPSFGTSLVNAAVDSCFAINGSNRLGITEEVFLDWLLRQPQTLVWISTLYRLATAENVNHEAKCRICMMTPISGLRYQCLRCFHYNLCQHCFFTGQISRGHKLNHPLQEYCHKSTSGEGTKAIVKMLKNKLSKKTTSKSKQRYLPIASSTSAQDPLPSEIASENADEIDGSTTPEDAVVVTADVGRRLGPDQQRELESVIVNLEDENRLLLAEIGRLHAGGSGGGGSDGGGGGGDGGEQRSLMLARQEALEDHNRQLELQLRRLRALLQYLQRTPIRSGDVTKAKNLRHLESTPSAQQACRADFDLLSPIKTSSGRPWERQPFGNLSSYARRSLPSQHLSSPYSPSAAATFERGSGQSFQRLSARAVLQSREYTSCSNRQRSSCDTKYTFHDISRDLLGSTCNYNNNNDNERLSHMKTDVDVTASTTMTTAAVATGYSRIQAELDDIIRQLENVYPGCSLSSQQCQQHQAQTSVRQSPLAEAKEIGKMQAECVG